MSPGTDQVRTVRPEKASRIATPDVKPPPTATNRPSVDVDLALDEPPRERVLRLRVSAFDIERPLQVADPAPDPPHVLFRGLLPEDRGVRLWRLREDDRRDEGADADRINHSGLVE